MVTFQEQWLCKALDKFKGIILSGLCSKVDVAYLSRLFKYELEKRETDINEKEWLTKIEVSKMLGVSTSTLDRMITRKKFPKGKKIAHQKFLIWKNSEIEQYRKSLLLKERS